MYPNRSSRVRMSFLRKCLALSTFAAVMIPTAAVAQEPIVIEPMFRTAQEQAYDRRVEARLWDIALTMMRTAVADAWAAEAREAAEAAARRSQPRGSRVPQPSGGGTYSGTASGSVNGYPCGGDLPSCEILRRESGGNPQAENPSSSASGLWQFIDGTWNGYGGYAHASDAPPEVQNEKARLTWAGGAGCRHWSMTASGC